MTRQVRTLWTPVLESEGHAVFLNPDGTAGAELRIRKLGKSNTAELIQQRMEELLKRAREAPRRGDSEIFSMKPNSPPASPITEQLWQAWQMEYRWRESSDQCIRDVVDVISPSNRFTHSVLISAWVCEQDLDGPSETQRQEILSSFRGETIR